MLRSHERPLIAVLLQATLFASALVAEACGRAELVSSDVDASQMTDAAVCSIHDAYTACGCGCCPGAPMTTRCVDTANGETFESIAAADQAIAASPGCAMVGCAMPIVYVCCP